MSARTVTCEGCYECVEMPRRQGQPAEWIGTGVSRFPKQTIALWCPSCVTDGTMAQQARTTKAAAQFAHDNKAIDACACDPAVAQPQEEQYHSGSNETPGGLDRTIARYGVLSAPPGAPPPEEPDTTCDHDVGRRCSELWPESRESWCEGCVVLKPAGAPPSAPATDPVCEHGTAMDVHCCNCHSGFLFDADSCVCSAGGSPSGPEGVSE
jgi:hypothetical protein